MQLQSEITLLCVWSVWVFMVCTTAFVSSNTPDLCTTLHFPTVNERDVIWNEFSDIDIPFELKYNCNQSQEGVQAFEIRKKRADKFSCFFFKSNGSCVPKNSSICRCPEDNHTIYHFVLPLENFVNGIYVWRSMSEHFVSKELNVTVNEPLSSTPVDVKHVSDEPLASQTTDASGENESNSTAVLIPVALSIVAVVIVAIASAVTYAVYRTFKKRNVGTSIRRHHCHHSRGTSADPVPRLGCSFYRGSNVSIMISNEIYQGSQHTRRDGPPVCVGVMSSGALRRSQAEEEEGDYAEIDSFQDQATAGPNGALAPPNLYVPAEEGRRTKVMDRPPRCNVKVSE